jgi:DNA-binding IclR family transcriptional regulator
VVRRRGWAAAYEVLPGVGAVATALPAAPDEAVSVICVGGPSARITEREAELARVLRECARGARSSRRDGARRGTPPVSDRAAAA